MWSTRSNMPYTRPNPNKPRGQIAFCSVWHELAEWNGTSCEGVNRSPLNLTEITASAGDTQRQRGRGAPTRASWSHAHKADVCPLPCGWTPEEGRGNRYNTARQRMPRREPWAQLENSTPPDLPVMVFLFYNLLSLSILVVLPLPIRWVEGADVIAMIKIRHFFNNVMI